MNDAEFGASMGELRDYFGEKSFGGKQSTVIWRTIGAISRAEFRQVIDTLVEEHTRAPTPGQIKKAALPYVRRAEEARRQEAVRQLNGESPCRICGNSGLMTALLNSKPEYEFSFVCSYCRAAEVYRFKRIPLWRDELKGEYTPVSLKPESYHAARALQERHLQREVAMSWVERLKTNPWALESLEKAGHGAGVSTVKDLMAQMGLGALVKEKK